MVLEKLDSEESSARRNLNGICSRGMARSHPLESLSLQLGRGGVEVRRRVSRPEAGGAGGGEGGVGSCTQWLWEGGEGTQMGRQENQQLSVTHGRESEREGGQDDPQGSALGAG